MRDAGRTGGEALLTWCLAAAPQLSQPVDRALPGLPLPHLRRQSRLHATLEDDIPEAVPPAQPLQYPVVLGTLELPLSFVRTPLPSLLPPQRLLPIDPLFTLPFHTSTSSPVSPVFTPVT